MSKAQFSLARFQQILQRVINSKTVTGVTVYWVCPDSACPGLLCPTDADVRVQRSCDPGRNFAATSRWMSLLQAAPEQVIVVDYTVTTTPTPTDFGKPESQILSEIQSELSNDLQNQNTDLASISMQSVDVRPCNDCQVAAPPADSDDDDGFHWWWWLVIAGGVLLCCCLALLLYCCCCRKKKEQEKTRDMDYAEKAPSSYASSDMTPPVAGRLGTGSDQGLTRTSESFSTANPVTENPMQQFYGNPQDPRPRGAADTEWQPYTIDWGDAGYNDPRPESARQ